MKTLYKYASVIFIILLSFLVTGSSYANSPPTDSLTIENKIVDIINKVESGIVTMAPVAYELAVQTVWIQAVVEIASLSILSILLLSLGWYATKRGIYGYRVDPYGKDNSIYILCMILGGFTFFFGVIAITNLITSTTSWITLFDPRAGLVIKVLNGVL